MIDAARDALAFSAGASRGDFETNRMIAAALMQRLLIIGEAANRISPERRQRHSDVPWRRIITMRNRLIHGYDDINLDILWSTVTEDLPLLIATLERVIASLDEE